MAKNRAENIFNRYSSALKGFITRQLSSDSKSESEDILHDLFYKFLVTDGEQESIENVSSWLYRVARNLIIDRSRKTKEEKMPYIPKQEMGDALKIPLTELLYDENPTPEGELINTIIREELNLALAELPPAQRNVFELNELQGVSFKEICEATDIPINTLISQKRYAVLHLRSRLERLYSELQER